MTNCEVIAMNIAIVDDEPVFLKQLHNRLREMKLPDCEIHEFTSGRDLLSFYVKGMYEVIILDVEMPDLTGLQTAERIRQIDGSVIISFLTNYAEFAVKGYDVGAFRYILKNQPDYVYYPLFQFIHFDASRQSKLKASKVSRGEAKVI